MRSQNRIQVLQFGQNAGGAFEGRHGLFLPHVLRVSKHDALRCVALRCAALVRRYFLVDRVSTPDDASRPPFLTHVFFFVSTQNRSAIHPYVMRVEEEGTKYVQCVRSRIFANQKIVPQNVRVVILN
jgi:hypothetical protein